jgi:biopolymer transport protein ExbB
MDITHTLKHGMLAFGAEPVMWLMLALSVASIGVIIERAIFFARVRADVHALLRDIENRLQDDDAQGAEELLVDQRSAEAAIVRAGLRVLDRGGSAVREAMAGAALLQRERLERGLSFLGTLASNTPFIGLFGTVIGIVMAFEQLSLSDAKSSTSALVMASIAEALVATAVGIGVAVPAVVAFNVFQQRIRVSLDQGAALGHLVLVHSNTSAPSGNPNEVR